MMDEEERKCPICKAIEDDCCCCVQDYWDEIERLDKYIHEYDSSDSIFIKHIESHAEVKNAPTFKGKAICKICGKTAEQIIIQEKRK
jgi:hypothetical protein